MISSQSFACGCATANPVEVVTESAMHFPGSRSRICRASFSASSVSPTLIECSQIHSPRANRARSSGE